MGDSQLPESELFQVLCPDIDLELNANTNGDGQISNIKTTELEFINISSENNDTCPIVLERSQMFKSLNSLFSPSQSNPHHEQSHFSKQIPPLLCLNIDFEDAEDLLSKKSSVENNKARHNQHLDPIHLQSVNLVILQPEKNGKFNHIYDKADYEKQPAYKHQLEYLSCVSNDTKFVGNVTNIDISNTIEKNIVVPYPSNPIQSNKSSDDIPNEVFSLSSPNHPIKLDSAILNDELHPDDSKSSNRSPLSNLYQPYNETNALTDEISDSPKHDQDGEGFSNMDMIGDEDSIKMHEAFKESSCSLGRHIDHVLDPSHINSTMNKENPYHLSVSSYRTTRIRPPSRNISSWSPAPAIHFSHHNMELIEPTNGAIHRGIKNGRSFFLTPLTHPQKVFWSLTMSDKMPTSHVQYESSIQPLYQNQYDSLPFMAVSREKCEMRLETRDERQEFGNLGKDAMNQIMQTSDHSSPIQRRHLQISDIDVLPPIDGPFHLIPSDDTSFISTTDQHHWNTDEIHPKFSQNHPTSVDTKDRHDLFSIDHSAAYCESGIPNSLSNSSLQRCSRVHLPVFKWKPLGETFQLSYSRLSTRTSKFSFEQVYHDHLVNQLAKSPSCIFQGSDQNPLHGLRSNIIVDMMGTSKRSHSNNPLDDDHLQTKRIFELRSQIPNRDLSISRPDHFHGVSRKILLHNSLKSSKSLLTYSKFLESHKSQHLVYSSNRRLALDSNRGLYRCNKENGLHKVVDNTLNFHHYQHITQGNQVPIEVDIHCRNSPFKAIRHSQENCQESNSCDANISLLAGTDANVSTISQVNQHAERSVSSTMPSACQIPSKDKAQCPSYDFNRFDCFNNHTTVGNHSSRSLYDSSCIVQNNDTSLGYDSTIGSSTCSSIKHNSRAEVEQLLLIPTSLGKDRYKDSNYTLLPISCRNASAKTSRIHRKPLSPLLPHSNHMLVNESQPKALDLSSIHLGLKNTIRSPLYLNRTPSNIKKNNHNPQKDLDDVSCSPTPFRHHSCTVASNTLDPSQPNELDPKGVIYHTNPKSLSLSHCPSPIDTKYLASILSEPILSKSNSGYPFDPLSPLKKKSRLS